MSTGFSRYWNDTKKHLKRLRYWIPEARKLHAELKGRRLFRYFTLCSSEMIDVFSLAYEGVIKYDSSTRKLAHVKFCEMDERIFPGITEMIGFEDSGFKGRLDDVVLFEDELGSDLLTTQSEINLEFEKLGESMASDVRAKLEQKRAYLMFQDSFPFDFLNLDFCDPYYPNPPNTMRINNTIQRIVEWQQRRGTEKGKSFSVKRFLLAITCRLDKILPREVHRRLSVIISDNSRRYSEYSQTIKNDNLRKSIGQWIRNDGLDFFLSSWPKEILAIVERQQWAMSFLGVVYYTRRSRDGKPYVIASILSNCYKTRTVTTHKSQSLWLLKRENRDKISNVSARTRQGRIVRKHFARVLAIRNEQASACSRPLLPS